jgi:DNA-binding HxlR family transcriptional regulator
MDNAVEPSVEQAPCTLQCTSIAFAVKILGDKWTSLIVLELSNGPRRFTELEHSLGIGPRTLSQRLEFLAEREVVSKTHYAEVPPRVEYQLLQKGKDLMPVLQSMATWCEKYDA